MAEGIANHLWGDQMEAFSAGTQVSFVNPLVIEVMKEIGIDISKHRSKNLSEFDEQKFDYVITLCGDANETCPLYIGGTKKRTSGSMIRQRQLVLKKTSCVNFAACEIK